MTPRSVHDNLILSYEVDGYNRRITLKTICREKQPHEYTDIVFYDVLAYDFRGDSLGTILFDIHEAPFEKVYDDYTHVFEAQKNWGWLPFRYESREDVLAELGARNVKAFALVSSIGMTGFVLAGGIRFYSPRILPLTHYLPTEFCLEWYSEQTSSTLVDEATLHNVTANEVRRWVGLPESEAPWEEENQFAVPPESLPKILERFGLEFDSECDYYILMRSMNAQEEAVEYTPEA